ncbi:MAG TPA: pentapeptide repeat-containing protein, partial [Anaerolineae bacterium]|nr:pentapeptide repeat-containing protein [Anaerolineae bacterium]
MTLPPALPGAERSSQLAGLGILLIVTGIWGTTFPLVKNLTAQMTGVELLFLRFAVAGAVALPVMLRRRPEGVWWRSAAEFGFLGWLGYQPGTLLNEYARGLSLTLFGVALVVWLTDSLGQRREAQLLAYLEEQRKAQEDAQLARESQLAKTQLIREVASGDPVLAERAIRELDGKGWLTDGTLSNTQLMRANLAGAKLGWVNLSGAFLNNINLQDADISYGNFSSAGMSDA